MDRTHALSNEYRMEERQADHKQSSVRLAKRFTRSAESVASHAFLTDSAAGQSQTIGGDEAANISRRSSKEAGDRDTLGVHLPDAAAGWPRIASEVRPIRQNQ
jgi:hypothetical protein